MTKIRNSLNFIAFALSAPILLFAACSQSNPEQEKTNADSAYIVSPLKQVFKDTLALNQNIKSPIFSGDFNGDGAPDTLWAVSQMKATLPKSVTLVEPWPHYESDRVSKDFSKGSKMRLAILHGKENHAFLIRDTNNISVLDTQAARELSVLPKADIPTLEEPDLNASAKGDIIVVPTEAGIDNYIYWDGKQYMLYQIMDLP